MRSLEFLIFGWVTLHLTVHMIYWDLCQDFFFFKLGVLPPLVLLLCSVLLCISIEHCGGGSSVVSSDRSIPTTILLVCDGNSAIATAYTAVSQPAPPKAFSALSSTQMTTKDRSPSIMSHSLKRKKTECMFTALERPLFNLVLDRSIPTGGRLWQEFGLVRGCYES